MTRDWNRGLYREIGCGDWHIGAFIGKVIWRALFRGLFWRVVVWAVVVYQKIRFCLV